MNYIFILQLFLHQYKDSISQHKCVLSEPNCPKFFNNFHLHLHACSPSLWMKSKIKLYLTWTEFSFHKLVIKVCEIVMSSVCSRKVLWFLPKLEREEIRSPLKVIVTYEEMAMKNVMAPFGQKYFSAKANLQTVSQSVSKSAKSL